MCSLNPQSLGWVTLLCVSIQRQHLMLLSKSLCLRCTLQDAAGMEREGENLPLPPPLIAEGLRGSSAPRHGGGQRCHASPCRRSESRAREPPYCWRQQLPVSRAQNQPPPAEGELLLEAISESTALPGEFPCSNPSPDLAPAVEITFCLPRHPQPVQFRWARASVCRVPPLHNTQRC